jgi:Pyruvate/2-oxoacid:ferredoxin oxidoreductase gamma subunit
MFSLLSWRGFLKKLSNVELAARKAQDRVDRSLLKRKSGPSTSAFTSFVLMVAPIWESLTGKKAKAYEARGQKFVKVPFKVPFVEFVGQLAEIAGEDAPSWKMVNTALKSRPPS